MPNWLSCKTGFVIYARYHFEIQIPPVKMLNMCSFGLFLEISTLKICEIPRLCYICECNALPLLSFDYWRILYQFFTFTYFIIRYHTLIRGAMSDNKAISKRFRTMLQRNQFYKERIASNFKTIRCVSLLDALRNFILLFL